LSIRRNKEERLLPNAGKGNRTPLKKTNWSGEEEEIHKVSQEKRKDHRFELSWPFRGKKKKGFKREGKEERTRNGLRWSLLAEGRFASLMNDSKEIDRVNFQNPLANRVERKFRGKKKGRKERAFSRGRCAEEVILRRPPKSARPFLLLGGKKSSKKKEGKEERL